MAFFELNSEITIGAFRFVGVHGVRIRRSLHSYGDTAVITIPSISVLQKGKVQADGSVLLVASSNPNEVTTAHKFNYRDPVLIKLGYNGELREEFRGFVRRSNLNMPMEVECEGYIQPLRLNIDVSHNYKKTSAKELLNLLTTGKDGKPTGITVHMADDMPLYKMALTHANGEDIIREIKKVTMGALSIFFITPTTLWCGLTYTAYAGGNNPFGEGTVAYRLGWNVVKDNDLKLRVVEGEPVQINLNNVNGAGKKIATASEAKSAKNKVHATMNNIQDKDALTKIANEVQYQRNYAGYEGRINSFLQPYSQPGYTAHIADTRFTERNGDYVVEGVEVDFGTNGARRRVEIGPKIGFNPDK